MSSWKLWQQKRHILVFLIVLGVTNLCIFKVNLSVAIVAMTSDRYETLQNGTVIVHEAEFQWNNVIQGYLLSSFFYGYVPSMPFGAMVGHQIGGKKALALTVGFSTLFAFISPWLAKWSIYAFMASRVLTGMLEGLTFPGIYVLLSKWIPESEKSRIAAQVHLGNYVGTVFSMLFFGYLAEVAGWRSLFWFSGTCGGIWVVTWLLVARETPRDHLSISKNELHYIESSLETHTLQNKNIPWKTILTSISVWIAAITMFCEGWGYYTLLALLPKYYNEVYHYDLSKMGLLAALPYILLSIGMLTIGQLYDRILAKNWVTVTVLRKICIGGSYLIEACFMIGTIYWENIAGNVFCMVIAVSTSSISKAAIMSLPMDLSYQWSGVVYGLCLTIAALPGILSPIISGYILSSSRPVVESYQIIFYLSVGMLIFGSFVFTLFGSADKLNLNPKKTDAKTTEEVN